MRATKTVKYPHPARVKIREGLRFLWDSFTRGDRVHIGNEGPGTPRALCGTPSRAFVEGEYHSSSQHPDRYVCPACYSIADAKKKTQKSEPQETPEPESNSHERDHAIQIFRSAEHKFETLACRLAASYASSDHKAVGASYDLYQRAIEARDAIAKLRKRIERSEG